MIRRCSLALVALLVLAWAGCSFERRPAAGTTGSAADSAAAEPAPDPTGLGLAAPEAVGEARSFFRELQELRRSGRLSEVRARIDPGASLFLGGRALNPEAPAPDLRSLLTLEGVPETDAVEAVDPFDGGVLFVVRYPWTRRAASSPDPSDRNGAVVETLLLSRDSTTWSVRFLQRSRLEAPRP